MRLIPYGAAVAIEKLEGISMGDVLPEVGAWDHRWGQRHENGHKRDLWEPTASDRDITERVTGEMETALDTDCGGSQRGVVRGWSQVSSS